MVVWPNYPLVVSFKYYPFNKLNISRVKHFKSQNNKRYFRPLSALTNALSFPICETRIRTLDPKTYIGHCAAHLARL